MISDKIIYCKEDPKIKKLKESIFDTTIEKIFSDCNLEDAKRELAGSINILQRAISDSEFDVFYESYINCIINILGYVDDIDKVYWIKNNDISNPRVIDDNKTLYFESTNQISKMDNALWIFNYANDKYGKKDSNKEYRKEW